MHVMTQDSASHGYPALYEAGSAPSIRQNSAMKAHSTFQSTTLVNYVAGVLGGISVTLVGHPFDTVKVRLQTQPVGSHALYRSTWDCVRKTYIGEGPRGFYAGIGSPLLGQMWFRAGSFAIFHKVRSNVDASLTNDQCGYYQRLWLSGAITGFFISILETPIDVVKTKLQTTITKEKMDPHYVKPFNSTPSCIRFLLQNYGVSGFYQGFSATVYRNVPANACFFPVNEILKDMRVEAMGYGSEKDLHLWERLVCGGTAGLCYWVGTCPLDTIKSKMMMTSLKNQRDNGLTWSRTVKVMWQEGGVARFYQGLAPLAARSVPACGAMFATVDIVRSFLA